MCVHVYVFWQGLYTDWHTSYQCMCADAGILLDIQVKKAQQTSMNEFDFIIIYSHASCIAQEMALLVCQSTTLVQSEIAQQILDGGLL